MKQIKKISLWLLLLVGSVATVFIACEKDDPDNVIAVTGISLDRTTITLAIGGEYTFAATISPEDATDTSITWTSNNESFATVSNGKVIAIAEGTATITAKAGDFTATCTVTIINTQINSDGKTGTVTDAEGSTYAIVKIGDQWWMAENLKVSTYNDGTAIPNVTDSATWAVLTTGAYCNYNNDASFVTKYGRLYNWYAVNTGKLAPAGWHVPTDAEWTTLTTYLGGTDIAGGKLKETGTAHWNTPNTGATNEFGFTALPSGTRYYGQFLVVGFVGGWWSSSAQENDTTDAIPRNMRFQVSDVYQTGWEKTTGHSIRCVKD